MKTRPPRPIVGEATAIRQEAATAVQRQDVSAIDKLVDRFSTNPNKVRNSRPKGDTGKP